MTPEKAQEALEWWGRGVFDHGAAEQALRTIANMHYEYDYQVLFMPDWVSAGERFATIESARQVVSDRRRGSAPTRIVRRLVSDPEVAE